MSEKVFIAMLWALQALLTFLIGTRLTINTDHSGLGCSTSISEPSVCVMRLTLRLAELDYDSDL